MPIGEEYASERLSIASRVASERATGTEPFPTPETSLHGNDDEHRHTEDLWPLPEDVEGLEPMMLKGQRYLCSIPRVVPEQDAQQSNTTVEEDAKELELAAVRGWELLKDMQGNCIYMSSGWWSYSFCYDEEVRQFHGLPPGRNVPHWPPVEDRSSAAFVLGKVEKDGDSSQGQRKTVDGAATDDGKEIRERGLARMETKGEMRYLVQKLSGGTTCDLTGKPRRIEVQVCTLAIQFPYLSLQ